MRLAGPGRTTIFCIALLLGWVFTGSAQADILLEGLNPAKQAKQAKWLRHNRASTLQRAQHKGRPILELLQRELTLHGLPPELAAIAVLESSLLPRQVSPDGYGGVWQLSPFLARQNGLKVGRKVDQRLDPLPATRAAAAHLKHLHDLFDDWTLVVAAYQCGKGRVQQALRKTGGGGFDLMEARRALPRHTIKYVYTVAAIMEELREEPTIVD